MSFNTITKYLVFSLILFVCVFGIFSYTYAGSYSNMGNCDVSSDCGTSGYTGSPVCQGNAVYQNYTTYTCNDAGTCNSVCANSTALTLKTTCGANQTCSDGACTDIHVACNTDSDCGTNSFSGSPFCTGNNVYKTYTTYTCNNPGTAQATCTTATSTPLWYACTAGQTCSNGTCNNQNITCNTNADCGTSGPTGSPFCQGNSVYQNYINYTCNNAGTASSYCSNNTNAQVQNTCSGNQTCSNGSCSGYNNLSVSCYASPSSATYGQQVVFNANVSGGSGSYNYSWYGICSSSSQTCNTTVYNSGSQTETVYVTSGSQTGTATCNVSSTQNQCNYHSYEQCNGSALYWYDSCGNEQDLAQVCSGGCYNNQCQYQNTQGYLTVTKQVRDLTTGNNWSSSTYASPNDVLMFLVTIQASGNQSIQNVNMSDYLPSNLIYNDQLVVSGANNGNYNNYSGISGISLGTINAGQTATVSYQVKVAPDQNFSFGTTTLNNSVSVSSSNGNAQNASATVIVNRGAVLGASSVSTGLTNNFWTDSFFLPLLITLLGIWLFRSGALLGLERWINDRKQSFKSYKTQRDLARRITHIKKSEKRLI